MTLSEDPRLFVLAGEASGDLLGAEVMQAIVDLAPRTRFQGVGGPQMRSCGMDLLFPSEKLQVMGLTDVLLRLPQLALLYYRTKRYILQHLPDAVVLIDYPGFNLRLATALREGGYTGKIVQYVSPTVWAHGSGRIQHLADTVDLLLTIFPFEKQCYASTQLKVAYVGHPLVDRIDAYQYADDWKEQVELETDRPVIGVFPGSRSSEVRHNFLNQLLAAEKLQAMHPDAQVAVSCAQEHLLPILSAKIARREQRFLSPIRLVPPRYSYELMRDSHVAIAVSGTVTLELALHETPTVVVYHVTPLNRLFAKHILGLTLTRYCIVNIVTRRDIFPELILDPFRLPTAFTYLEAFYTEGSARRRCQSSCRQIHNVLNGKGASSKAARAILRLLNWTSPLEECS